MFTKFLRGKSLAIPPLACIGLPLMIIVGRAGLECAAIVDVAFHWYAWWATACFLLKADKGGGGHPGVSLFTWRPGGGGPPGAS